MESVPLNRPENGPILHVVVIGFHHKKGCQVEYVYPAFEDGDSVENAECPEEWKHLPSLALPDGAHNFEKDTIYFHMPSRNDPAEAVFGISCYRQMNAESLINRSADITRGTVQKSVCIISTLPLYGLINAKLELITHAYFDEKDFSKVALLEETYKSLNSSLKEDLTQGQQVFLGLSVRDLVLQFKHKVVLLLKLVLLERKVLFLNSPVKDLCTTILSLLSLFPGMIESGLQSCVKLREFKDDSLSFEIISDACDILNADEREKRYETDGEVKNAMDACETENKLKEHGTGDFTQIALDKGVDGHDNVDFPATLENSKCNSSKYVDAPKGVTVLEAKKTTANHLPTITVDEDRLLLELEDLLDSDAKEKVDMTKFKLEFQEKDTEGLNGSTNLSEKDVDSLKGSKTSLESKESGLSVEGQSSKVAALKGKLIGALSYWTSKDKSDGMGDHSPAEVADEVMTDGFSETDSETTGTDLSTRTAEERLPPLVSDVMNLDISNCGLPLRVFEEGMLCHPYLSLPFLDLMKDPCVRGFVAGATNVLFKQKRNLVDVIVEIDGGKVEILDNDLKRQLHLTTEDLRFADYLVKNVSEDQQDVFLDGTGWEGGDEWLRAQFKLYIICLLRTSMLQEGAKEIEAFNPVFMSAWQSTQNYNQWKNCNNLSVLEINPGHPFQGQLSMSDMRLRISHTIQNSERGRKINQAVVNTGKAVAQTSKALGGAITQAKTAVSSWLQMFGSPQPSQQLQQVE